MKMLSAIVLGLLAAYFLPTWLALVLALALLAYFLSSEAATPPQTIREKIEQARERGHR